MENMNFLQRPGGNGPTANRVKPLGTMATQVPGLYANTPQQIEFRRATGIDDVNRVDAQYRMDRGEYVREPVGPTNYEQGNIMPSSEITGLAGYNQRGEMKLPMRAADISKAEYLVKTQNTMDPNLRAQMQILTTMPQQNFFNSQDPTANLFTQNYQMPDSLPLQLPMGVRK